jgi:hypothetical protein
VAKRQKKKKWNTSENRTSIHKPTGRWEMQKKLLVGKCGRKRSLKRWKVDGVNLSQQNSYELDGRGSIPGRERDQSVQIGTGAHPASCTMGTGGSFPGRKWPWREPNHSFPSRVEVKNGGSIPLLPNTSSYRSNESSARRTLSFYLHRTGIERKVVDWIEQAQYGIQWCSFVNMFMNSHDQ